MLYLPVVPTKFIKILPRINEHLPCNRVNIQVLRSRLQTAGRKQQPVQISRLTSRCTKICMRSVCCTSAAYDDLLLYLLTYFAKNVNKSVIERAGLFLLLRVDLPTLSDICRLFFVFVVCLFGSIYYRNYTYVYHAVKKTLYLPTSIKDFYGNFL